MIDAEYSGLMRANERIAAHYRVAESEVLPLLIAALGDYDSQFAATQHLAHQLLDHLRHQQHRDWLSQFLSEYQLTNAEGIALLQLSEALLRVPDTATVNLLLRDKLVSADWQTHIGHADSFVVNGTTLGLSLAQSLLEEAPGILHRMVARLGEPLVRNIALSATRLLANHFVLGETVEMALQRAAARQLTCSFDMLGEAAKTRADAERYFHAYAHAIKITGQAASLQSHSVSHSISVKLSALYPRYEPMQRRHATVAIADRLIELARLAAHNNLQLTVDAEECERLEMSLQIIERVARASALREWNGLGVAVQAYQKRALPVLQWIGALAHETHKPMHVRLVKGAYWDTEIKRCQQAGLIDYPVFTRKAATDVSYLACAHVMLHDQWIHCAFATHNALTAAQLLNWMHAFNVDKARIEFQRLHGMGEELYAQVEQQHGLNCRVYAPVGGHRELLAYLVRRMLENGANSSFVQQLRRDDFDEKVLLADPVKMIRDTNFNNPCIPVPSRLYGDTRLNSQGLDLTDQRTLQQLNEFIMRNDRTYTSEVISSVDVINTTGRPVCNPADVNEIIGQVHPASLQDINAVVNAAHVAQDGWSQPGVETRAISLEKTAELLQQEMQPLIALLVVEAGKTRADAMNEVREAIDFCRYYAASARNLMKDVSLAGPTGESNTLCLAPRGVFACISPWNFPLAILVGQIAAALVTGNAVVAKPAPQTPLIAAFAIRLLHQGGIPRDVLHLMPGDALIGEALVAHPHIAGVAFTGSTATARRIAQTLLNDVTRPLVPMIAETGGINAMIVDSTALPEQVVSDVITSAFLSAGQRCSALRLLCLQEEIYESVLNLLQGAMIELRVGDPRDEDTDIGPVIDSAALTGMNQYIAQHRDQIRYQLPLRSLQGHFVAPAIIEIDDPEKLQQEIFGPVLHVTRWRGDQLQALINNVNGSGYGLTLGVHSRLDSTVATVRQHARVGNIYVNRSMTGAVVGVQPFGGEGLSGTGFKAGGPHYLLRFCTERVVSIDTTAAGGNAALLGAAI
ncbi:MAG TPA: bifunctional proline dehydrogenase/L-glutamate gamma-semialdehyde dehydrogenase PutA [Steroidobacteraceae bacterium]|nr:bifunctional proline dehydrogenase/L-glutamate gamma-semialdehyde dehydrogenase PutA [Steroidobacteraceae bacterium]